MLAWVCIDSKSVTACIQNVFIFELTNSMYSHLFLKTGWNGAVSSLLLCFWQDSFLPAFIVLKKHFLNKNNRVWTGKGDFMYYLMETNNTWEIGTQEGLYTGEFLRRGCSTMNLAYKVSGSFLTPWTMERTKDVSTGVQQNRMGVRTFSHLQLRVCECGNFVCTMQ